MILVKPQTAMHRANMYDGQYDVFRVELNMMARTKLDENSTQHMRTWQHGEETTA